MDTTQPQNYYIGKLVRIFSLAMVVSGLFTTGACFTEVFSIAKTADDVIFYAGNRDSNFFIGRRDSDCSIKWESSAGSTRGDDDNDENREVFYDVIVGSDGLVYAVGTTKGNFSFPNEEVPTLDAAIVVYNATNGKLIKQAQYDVGNGLDDVGKAVVENSHGNLLLAVYGTPHNVHNSVVHETRLLEISRDTLELIHTHHLNLTTNERLISITGGPSISDIIYVRDQEAIVAAGQFLGRGVLFLYSLRNSVVLRQTEWGSTLGNMQIGAVLFDGTGAFYVTGSSDTNVLDNADLKNDATAHHHAYVIRYDNLLSGVPVHAWVRQLAGYGSSQSGDDIKLDPITGELVVIGSFDGNSTVSDKQSGRAYELNTVTNSGLTDIFAWYIDSDSGSFTNLQVSFEASTPSEDRANALQVLSSRRLEIGGVINDGADDEALVCSGESVWTYLRKVNHFFSSTNVE